MTLSLVAAFVWKAAFASSLLMFSAIVGRIAGPFFAAIAMTLPLNSGAGFVLIALDQPSTFLADASYASFAMTGPILLFVTGYVLAARRWSGFFPGFLAGAAMWFAGAYDLEFLPRGLATAFGLLAVGLLVALPLARSSGERHVAGPGSGWVLVVARAVVGGVAIATVAAFAAELGPHLSGLALAFPLLMSGSAWIMCRLFGPRFAADAMAASKVGLASYGVFNLGVHLMAVPLGSFPAMGVAFLLSLAAALLVALWGRPAPRARPPGS